MASRIAYIPREEPPKSRPAKKPAYLAWLHTLPCAVTGRNDVEAAHVSFAMPWYGHYGRAKGTKAPDMFALPLCRHEHARQHAMNERDYGRQPASTRTSWRSRYGASTAITIQTRQLSADPPASSPVCEPQTRRKQWHE